MDDFIQHRVSRIYAAIGAIEEHDLEKMKLALFRSPKGFGVFQDFRAGQSDEELLNQAHSVIYNIAHLRDHLLKWASDHSKNKQKISDAINGSLELQLLLDVSNADKHGENRRDGGFSGKHPRIEEINRVLQLSGASSYFINLKTGKPQATGTVKAIVTGNVVDKNGNMLGDLHKMALKSVEVWEQLLSEFGIKIPE